MRKILFLVVLVVMCVSLFAQVQITPYGSARVGFWYEMEDEDYVGANPKYDRMNMNLDLQSNSRFGVNFRSNDLTAQVEIDANGEIRQLWGRHSFGTWSLLAGHTEDGTNRRAKQVFGNDNMLTGYGAVYGGRNPMITFAMNNGFYASLIRPYTKNDPIGASQFMMIGHTDEEHRDHWQDGIDALIPRINVGYDINFHNANVTLKPTAVFQMYQYNKDRTEERTPNDVVTFAGSDESVVSFLFGVTVDYKATDAWAFGLNFNVGQNTGNMGYRFGNGDNKGHDLNRALWTLKEGSDTDYELLDAMTFGGFLTAAWQVNPTLNLNLGFGAAITQRDDLDNDPMKMAGYLQGIFRITNNLSITPEFGMFMEGDSAMNYNAQGDLDPNGSATALGNLMYFGTQLRFDF